MSTTTGTVSILTDEPQWSSAALCISLNLSLLSTTTNSFKPEYTHQCVEGEVFRGYRPFQTTLNEAMMRFRKQQQTFDKTDDDDDDDDNDNVLLHKSHRGQTSANTTATELAINIQLAPSCRKCSVDIQMKKKKNGKEELIEEPTTKKQRLEVDSENNNTNTNNHNNNHAGDDTTLMMTREEIQQSISKALPDIITIDNNINNNNNNNNTSTSITEDYLETPVGTVLEEFTITTTTTTTTTTNDTNISNDYCISFADGSIKEVNDYHAQVQKLALWFIENADDVDVSNQDSGFWKVLYLFRKHNNNNNNNDNNNNDNTTIGYSLVGYMTLFHFMAPFHKPNPGIIVRICQALVFPPYQGQGFGKRMMQTVYDIVIHDKYHEKAYNNINNNNNNNSNNNPSSLVQINVEDPAPGFIALRNKLDLKLMAENMQWWRQQPGSGAEGTISTTNHHHHHHHHHDDDDLSVVTDEGFFVALSEAEAMAVSGKAKITPRQVHIVREMLKLLALKAYSSGDDSKKEALTTKFRLMVKKRLNKEHAEEMSSYATKDRKKAYLAELYDMEMKLYESLLPSRGSSA